MDGIALTAALRNEHHYAGIIVALTAEDSENDRDLCLRSGFDFYIKKPLKIQGLRGALQLWAKRHRS